MKYRKLRIAWSVGWGFACLLICMLWARSNWYWDELYNPITNKHLVIVESASSRVIVILTSTVRGRWIWHISEELHGKYWAGPSNEQQEANRYTGIGGFAYYATPWNRTYRAPHWFLALILATLAVIPWLRWSKRFSLRSLLIATTLVAVGLGLVVWAVR